MLLIDGAIGVRTGGLESVREVVYSLVSRVEVDKDIWSDIIVIRSKVKVISHLFLFSPQPSLS